MIGQTRAFLTIQKENTPDLITNSQDRLILRHQVHPLSHSVKAAEGATEERMATIPQEGPLKIPENR